MVLQNCQGEKLPLAGNHCLLWAERQKEEGLESQGSRLGDEVEQPGASAMAQISLVCVCVS